MSMFKRPSRTHRIAYGAGRGVRSDEFKSEPLGPQDRTQVAVVALHISTVLSLMTASVIIVVLSFQNGDGIPAEHRDGILILLAFAVVCIGLTVLSAMVSVGLQHRSPWAWTAAVILFAVYLPSPYLPMGLTGLAGALCPGTRAEFSRRRRGRSSGYC